MPEPDHNLLLGAEMRQKFQFYSVALTFGILALAVQTATFEIPLPARIAELLSWLLMLLSGLVGLWRLEGIPDLHERAGWRQRTEANALEMIQEQQERGARTVLTLRGSESIETAIGDEREQLTRINNQLSQMEGAAHGKYVIQKVCFVLGLVSLMVARGYGPLLGIVREW